MKFFSQLHLKRGLFVSKGKKTHYQSQASGHGTSNDDILDDEEESMDWWTKYFASVDAMIEVIRTRSLFVAALVFNARQYFTFL